MFRLSSNLLVEGSNPSRFRAVAQLVEQLRGASLARDTCRADPAEEIRVSYPTVQIRQRREVPGPRVHASPGLLNAAAKLLRKLVTVVDTLGVLRAGLFRLSLDRVSGGNSCARRLRPVSGANSSPAAPKRINADRADEARSSFTSHADGSLQRFSLRR